MSGYDQDSLFDDASELIFDIESVPDAELIQQVTGLSLDDFVSERVEDGKGDFVPLEYQRPVCAAFLVTNRFLEPLEYGVVGPEAGDDLNRTAQRVAATIFRKRSDLRIRFITFGGRRFDIPIIEQEAYRGDWSMPSWFKLDVKSWEDPRNRYSERYKLDLREWLTNHGTTTGIGGLDRCAILAGAPGKIEGVSGADVAGLYEKGEHHRMMDYCLTDVLATTAVACRVFKLIGVKIHAGWDGLFADFVRTEMKGWNEVEKWINQFDGGAS